MGRVENKMRLLVVEDEHSLREHLDRLTALVRTLLEMSNLQSVSRTDQIALAPLVEEILTDLTPLAQKNGITLQQDCEELGMVGSDALIYRLVFNLVENGIKYNRPGGAGLGLFFHLKHNKEVPLGLKFIRPKGRLIGEIYEIGFPSIIMMCIGSLTNYIMNLLLVSFTKTAVAVYGAYFKLQSFFFLPVFGINNGLIPIIGYNYGAGKVDRIHRTIRYGVLFAAVFMLLGLALFELAPGLLLSAFNPSAEMLDIGTHAMRRIALHFPIAAFCIVAGSACQALNKSMFSLITSCMRQIFALIPAAYLLSLTGDVNNIWWCFLIAEIVSFIFSFFFLRKAMRDADRRLRA